MRYKTSLDITYRVSFPSQVGPRAGREGRELQHRPLYRRGGLKQESCPLAAGCKELQTFYNINIIHNDNLLLYGLVIIIINTTLSRWWMRWIWTHFARRTGKRGAGTRATMQQNQISTPATRAQSPSTKPLSVAHLVSSSPVTTGTVWGWKLVQKALCFT